MNRTGRILSRGLCIWNWSCSLRIDFGRTAGDYSAHRAGFPEAFFERLATYGLGHAGATILDVGTGTGTVARGLARRGCEAIALDRSSELLRAAHKLDAEAGVRVDYLQAVAECLPVMSGTLDLVTAGQCWHWFDRPAAAKEAMRVLKPGGNLVVAHFDWLALPDNLVTATEVLVLKHNPEYGMSGSTGFYTHWTPDIMAAGFEGIETFSFDLDVVYSHEGWRGRVRACNGVGASLAPEQISRFDADLKVLLEDKYPDQPLAVPHRVFALMGRRPA